MRVFIIDTSKMAPELRGGLIGVEGPSNPTAAEKHECVETVSHFAADGWAIAADPHAPIGWLAALTADVPSRSRSRTYPRRRNHRRRAAALGGRMRSR